MLVDSDPRFRRELATALESIGFQVVFESDSDRGALRVLDQWSQPRTVDSTASISLDLIILSLELPPSGMDAIALCQTLRRRYPALPILTMSETATPALVSAAYQAGAMGYCQKSTAIPEWTQVIRQVVAGYSSWGQGMAAITQAPQSLPAVSRLDGQPTALATIKRRVRQSGLEQIDAAIAQINEQLRNPSLSPLDQLFLTGRRRELRASRWLVKRLLITPTQPDDPSSVPLPPQPDPARSADGADLPPPPLQTPTVSPAPITDLIPQVESTAIRSIQAALFDATFAKLQFGLRNLTDTPLEIDILRDDRKQELLEIVLRQLENILTELRQSSVEVTQLLDKKVLILEDVWQAATLDFFGRYTALPLGDSPTDPLNQQPIEIVDVLLQDAAIVQAEILNKIPMVADFFAHLLFQVPLMVDEASYVVGSVEAMTRMEALLQNLVIQVGNAVMQPLLNRFGNVVAVKQNFYDRRLLSTREIERFRNNLSWRYRVQRYFKEPTAIFESRYSLLVLADLGIVKSSIYSPRNQELDELAGIGLAVTLALEARDAIAPRLRTAISFVGSGVVYVLTEVIGRGIGLIGRGIIKGVGNVVQDPTFKRNSQRWRG